MKGVIGFGLAGLMLIGCGEQNSAADASASDGFTGVLSGTIDEVPFQLQARCINHDSEQFRFRSEAKNGMRLSGMQRGEKLIVDYSTGESAYSTPNLPTFEKTDTGANGAGPLFLDGSGADANLVFQLRCQ